MRLHAAKHWSHEQKNHQVTFPYSDGATLPAPSTTNATKHIRTSGAGSFLRVREWCDHEFESTSKIVQGEFSKAPGRRGKGREKGEEGSWIFRMAGGKLCDWLGLFVSSLSMLYSM